MQPHMDHYGPVRLVDENPINRSTVPGRAIIERQTILIDDLALEPEDDLPARFARSRGVRTMLATPLFREGIPIGAISIRRQEVRPFTDKQIVLLETFAAQAVIAIENVRLFKELQERNRDLTEALEQQTATSEILRVIASSPNDLTPVLHIVAKNAARLCEASGAQVFRKDDDVLRLAANYGELASRETRPISRDTVAGRAFIDRRTIHVHNPEESAAEFPESSTAVHQTRLATPLLRDDVALGVIGIRRTDMRPFTESQIKLVETFANQAVIAIENVRLFKELDERTNELTRSVGELRALGEVGQTVSSTLDLETVLTSIVSHAVQLSGTDGGAIYEYDESSEDFSCVLPITWKTSLSLRSAPIRLALATAWSVGRRRTGTGADS